MINAPRFWITVTALTVVAATVPKSAVLAQAPGQNVPVLGMYSLPAAAVVAAPLTVNAMDVSEPVDTNGPMARLVRTPNSSEGLPPFALADQAGKIQRFVEPVPGIDLQPYVGQVIVVRHDTGRTLLATQLELPPQPLHALIEDPTDFAQLSAIQDRPNAVGSISRQAGFVKRAQFVDDDDATVQLLPDKEAGDKSALVNEVTEANESGEITSSDQAYPSVPDGALHASEGEEEIPFGPPHGEPSDGYPQALDTYPSDFYGLEACPECGGFHSSQKCRPHFGHGPAFVSRPSKPCSLFGDVEFNFLRTHLPETSAGKLSEKYEFSPRLIVGFRDTGRADGRARYWNYGRDTRLLGGTPIRVDFDVLDVEGTHSFVGRHSEVTVGAGFRLAEIDLTDDEGEVGGSDLIGMTLSADGRAPLFNFHGCRIAAVYGGRLSILGGDWGGDPDNDFIGGLVQDDNVVVHELQAGFDIATCCRDVDVHARLGFEMQNWHSDALSQNAGTDSIGFLGPGLQLGAEF